MGNRPSPVPAFLPGKGMPLRQCWPGFQLCISLWVLRNIFLQPGQGMPPGRVTSGPAHKVKPAPLKYKTSKQPPDTQLRVVGADFGCKSEFKAKFNGI